MNDRYQVWDDLRRATWPNVKHHEFESWDDWLTVAKYSSQDEWVAINYKDQYEKNLLLKATV
jgi:hypothetical protein